MQPKLTLLIVATAAAFALGFGFFLRSPALPAAVARDGAMFVTVAGEQRIVWKDGSDTPWAHRHQRILTEPDDIEATRLAYNLPSFPAPILVVFESDPDLRVIAVHSLNDGECLWRR